MKNDAKQHTIQILTMQLSYQRSRSIGLGKDQGHIKVKVKLSLQY